MPGPDNPDLLIEAVRVVRVWGLALGFGLDPSLFLFSSFAPVSHDVDYFLEEEKQQQGQESHETPPNGLGKNIEGFKFNIKKRILFGRFLFNSVSFASITKKKNVCVCPMCEHIKDDFEINYSRTLSNPTAF